MEPKGHLALWQGINCEQRHENCWAELDGEVGPFCIRCYALVDRRALEDEIEHLKTQVDMWRRKASY